MNPPVIKFLTKVFTSKPYGDWIFIDVDIATLYIMETSSDFARVFSDACG